MKAAKRQPSRPKAWRAAVVTILAVAWTFLAFVLASSRAEERAENVEQVVLHVEGMTCEACAVGIRGALGRVRGVESAKVDVAEKRVVIAYDPAQVRPQQLVEAVKKMGYVARLATPEGQ